MKLHPLVPFLTFALLTPITAVANSTAFNGFVQTSGNTGIDFGNLGGGNYRVTMTTSGQLNFRYTIDGQTFDSNPEVAILDLAATTTQPLGYASTSANYSGTATIRLPSPGPGEQPVYTSTFNFTAPTAPSLFFTQLSMDSGLSSPGATQLNFRSDSLEVSANVEGRTFNFAPLSTGTINVAPQSLMAQVADNRSNFFYSDSGLASLAAADNPEPGTLFLMGGALLAVGLLARRRPARRL